MKNLIRAIGTYSQIQKKQSKKVEFPSQTNSEFHFFSKRPITYLLHFFFDIEAAISCVHCCCNGTAAIICVQLIPVI